MNNNIKKIFSNYKIYSIIGIFLAALIALNVINYKENKKSNLSTLAAEDYFLSGNKDKAIEEYTKLSVTDKMSPEWDLKIAEVYSVEGEYPNSNKYLDLAKELQNLSADDYNSIVFTELMNKDYKKAKEDGEKALSLFSGSNNLIKTMFTVYMANNEPVKAKNILTKYNVSKDSAYDFAEIARLQLIVGDKTNGYANLKKAWYADKDEFKVFDVISQIALYNSNDLLEDISGLIEKDKDELAYKMWMAKIYSSNADTVDQATEVLNELKGKDVGKIEIKLIEAYNLQNQGKTADGDKLINQVIKDNPDDYRAYHTASWYYLKKKDYSRALTDCIKSINLNRKYPDNYAFLMPEILLAQGKDKEAEPYFRRALYLEPYNYNIMINTANYYWYTEKNVNKAYEYFNLAEIVKPTDPEIKYSKALIHIINYENSKDKTVKAAESKDAIILLNQCIKLNQEEPRYHRTLGTLYMKMGNVAAGIKEIRYAYEADESDLLNLNNAGVYYITVETNLEKGLYNIQSAFNRINDQTDDYTKKTVTENLKKAKELATKFANSKGNETITIPDFVLFY
jgi:tetratricopeptide (TPR) repeat protein